MKTLLLFFVMILANCANAQLIITTKVIDDYEAAFKKSNAQPELLKRINEVSSGLAMFTIDKVDTLNKKDIKSEYINLHAVKSEDATYSVFPFRVNLINDSLVMSSGIFWGSEIIAIHKNKVTATYNDRRKSPVFRLKLSDKKNEFLVAPMQTLSIKLSTSEFKVGTILYGEVNYTTVPFYEDDSFFASGFIEKQIHIKYVFKTVIKTIYDLR